VFCWKEMNYAHKQISHSPFCALQFIYYNLNLQMHTLLLESQYYNTPAPIFSGLTGPSSGSTQLYKKVGTVLYGGL